MYKAFVLNRIYIIGVLFVFCFLYSCIENDRTIKSHSYLLNNRQVDTISFRYGRYNEILVNVIQGGKACTYIFDTGAEGTIISMGGALIESERATITDNAGRQYKAEFCNVDTLKLGNTHFVNYTLYKRQLNGVEGVLGGDIIRNYVWKIDFINQQIEIAREASVFNVQQKPLILTLNKNTPKVKVKHGKHAKLFILDTGYSGFAQIKSERVSFKEDDTAVWKSLGYTSNYNIFGNDTIEREFFSKAILSDLHVGQITFKNEIVDCFENRQNNLLGLDFLRRFSCVVIDYQEGKLYLGEELYKTFNYLDRTRCLVNSLGVSIGLTESLCPEIKGVIPALFGSEIQLGDTVVSINGNQIFKKDKSFFKDSIIRGDNFIRYEPSSYNTILDSFMYLQDTVEIEIKNMGVNKKVTLVRMHNLFDIPDTVHRFDVPVRLAPVFEKGVKHSLNNGQYYMFLTKDEIKNSYNGVELSQAK